MSARGDTGHCIDRSVYCLICTIESYSESGASRNRHLAGVPPRMRHETKHRSSRGEVIGIATGERVPSLPSQSDRRDNRWAGSHGVLTFLHPLLARRPARIAAEWKVETVLPLMDGGRCKYSCRLYIHMCQHMATIADGIVFGLSSSSCVLVCTQRFGQLLLRLSSGVGWS